MRVDDGLDVSPVWWPEPRAYHVHFWQQLSHPLPPSVPLWESTLYRLSEAQDIVEVLDWAQANAAGRVIAIYVEVPPIPPAPTGLMLLYGANPTSA